MRSVDDEFGDGGDAATKLQVALIIPTHNAAQHWKALCEGIRKQSEYPDQVIVVDSSSTDGTSAAARDAGFEVVEIDGRDFDHGGTRQLAAEHASKADILIYLTQDAVPSKPDAFRNLIAAFEDPAIGACVWKTAASRRCGCH